MALRCPPVLAVAGVICVFVAASFLVVGLGTPEWYDSSAFNYGLFKICVGDVCTDLPSSAETDAMMAVRAFCVLGFLVLCAAFLVGSSTFCIQHKAVLPLAAGTSLASGVFTVIGLAVWRAKVVDKEVGYSLALCGLAMAIALAGGLMFLMAYLMERSKYNKARSAKAKHASASKKKGSAATQKKCSANQKSSASSRDKDNAALNKEKEKKEKEKREKEKNEKRETEKKEKEMKEKEKREAEKDEKKEEQEKKEKREKEGEKDAKAAAPKKQAVSKINSNPPRKSSNPRKESLAYDDPPMYQGGMNSGEPQQFYTNWD